ADLRIVARLLPAGNPLLPARGLQPAMVRRDPRPEEVRRWVRPFLPGRRPRDRDRTAAGRTGRALRLALPVQAARAALQPAADAADRAGRGAGYGDVRLSC